jgi:putative lipoic acid-binding regulatory protein
MDEENQNPSCSGPFGGAVLEYPLNFDLRIIYRITEVDFADLLRKTLETLGVPCSLIQGVVKPNATYGRMGARVVVESKAKMDALYAAVAALPGVKAVI